jgi:hypothetical protein
MIQAVKMLQRGVQLAAQAVAVERREVSLRVVVVDLQVTE